MEFRAELGPMESITELDSDVDCVEITAQFIIHQKDYKKEVMTINGLKIQEFEGGSKVMTLQGIVDPKKCGNIIFEVVFD